MKAVNNRNLIRSLLFAGVVAGTVSSQALPIPDYTFVPGTRQGTYFYGDETGNQLTDGLYGPGRLTSQADAIPYLGWLAPQVTLTFDFGDFQTFNSVSVSSLQAWIGNIALPDLHLYSSIDGQTWTFVDSLITPETSANNYQKALLTLDGLDITAQYLQIELDRNNIGPWIFIDEVLFSGSAPTPEVLAAIRNSNNVPEAASTFALLGLGMSSHMLFRRRK